MVMFIVIWLIGFINVHGYLKSKNMLEDPIYENLKNVLRAYQDSIKRLVRVCVAELNANYIGKQLAVEMAEKGITVPYQPATVVKSSQL